MQIITKLYKKKAILLSIVFLLLSTLFYPVITSEDVSDKDASDILWWYDLNAPSFGSAATADIDDDGLLEIVFGTYFNDEHVYALNANNGTLLWKYNTGGCNDASPVIYDVDNDDDLEVIIPTSSPYTVYCFDGRTGAVEWSTSTGYPNCIDSPPAIADVDNDELPEVILGTFYGNVFCLNGENGSIQWQINLGTDSYIQSAPNILDINNDGQLDIVVAQYGGDCRVYTLYGNNGSTIWFSDLPSDDMYHGGSFADIDEDGKPEIVIGCYDSTIYVFNAEDGSLLWQYDAPHYVASPTSIADLNNDNHLEIVFTSYNTIGVLNYTGDLVWDYSTGGSMFRGASITDTNNDNILDVIAGSTDGTLQVLSGNNGSLIWSKDLENHYGNTYQIDHAPILADFNNDTTMDVCIIGGYGSSSPSENNHGRVYVLDAGNGIGPGWPMFRHDIHHSACFHYQAEQNNDTIIYVDDDADSSWYDATHVRTIQEGINNASDGFTVYVYNGMYIENVVVNKQVELIGENTNTTIIDGNRIGDVLTIQVANVTVQKFTIQHSGDNMYQDKGVRILDDTCDFQYNNVTQNAGAILIYNSKNCSIENNTFYNSTHDVYFNQVMNSTLKNNYISNCRTVYIGESNHNDISNNNIVFTNAGFYLIYSNYNHIHHNNISYNGKYPYVGFGLLLEHSSLNLIESNIIQNNTDEGLSVQYSSSHNNTIRYNDISNNSVGILLFNSAINNYVYHNNIYGNIQYNAKCDGLNIWDNGYPSGGNYWGDYTGSDEYNGPNQDIIGPDGIGDAPYIFNNNQDHYPFMSPSAWIEEIDVNQSIFNRGFPIRHAADGDWAGAQNFLPTVNTITKCEIYIRKFGTPEFNLTVELREDAINGPILDSLVFTPEEVPSTWSWLELEFTDITITPSIDYFIVCPPAPSGVTTSFGYEWGYAFGNQYDDGSFWFTRNGGGLWRDLPTMYEFVFKTYGYY